MILNLIIIIIIIINIKKKKKHKKKIYPYIFKKVTFFKTLNSLGIIKFLTNLCLISFSGDWVIPFLKESRSWVVKNHKFIFAECQGLQKGRMLGIEI